MQTTNDARIYLNKKKKIYKETEAEYLKKPFSDDRDELLKLLFEFRSNFVKQFEQKINDCEKSTTEQCISTTVSTN